MSSSMAQTAQAIAPPPAHIARNSHTFRIWK